MRKINNKGFTIKGMIICAVLGAITMFGVLQILIQNLFAKG